MLNWRAQMEGKGRAIHPHVRAESTPFHFRERRLQWRSVAKRRRQMQVQTRPGVAGNPPPQGGWLASSDADSSGRSRGCRPHARLTRSREPLWLRRAAGGGNGVTHGRNADPNQTSGKRATELEPELGTLRGLPNTQGQQRGKPKSLCHARGSCPRHSAALKPNAHPLSLTLARLNTNKELHMGEPTIGTRGCGKWHGNMCSERAPQNDDSIKKGMH